MLKFDMPQRTDVLLRIRPTVDGEPMPLDSVDKVELAIASPGGKIVLRKDGEIVGDYVTFGITHEDSDILPSAYRVEIRVTTNDGVKRYQLGTGQINVTPSIFGRDEG